MQGLRIVDDGSRQVHQSQQGFWTGQAGAKPNSDPCSNAFPGRPATLIHHQDRIGGCDCDLAMDTLAVRLTIPPCRVRRRLSLPSKSALPGAQKEEECRISALLFKDRVRTWVQG